MVAIKDLLTDLERGLYAIPESQREFKWQNYKVRDLAESIFNGYPIGTITVWKMPEEFRKEYSYLFRPIIDELEEKTKKNGEYLVIDGLQRLTSLLLLKRGEIKVGGRRRLISLYINPWNLNMELRRKSESDPKWFKVQDIIDKTPYELVQEKERIVDDPAKLGDKSALIRKLEELRYRFMYADVNIYEIRIDERNYLDIFDKISRIFVLLNSKGTRVTFSDMLLALLTGKIRREIGDSAVKRFKVILDGLGDYWNVGESVVARCFMANFTGKVDISDTFRKMESSDADKIISTLDELRDELKKVTKLLERRLGIKKIEYLRSRNLIVPLTYLMHTKYRSMDVYDIPKDDVKKIARWLIIASFEGRYTGRLSEDLNMDLSAIEKKGIDGLLSKLSYNYILAEWIEGDYTNAHLTLLSILLTLNGAKDWDIRGQPRLIRDLRADEIHIHHIFPEKYIDPKLYDDIGNITLISSDANQKIGDDHPANYLQKINRLERSKHCIPDNEYLWKNPEEFIRERRRLIFNSINDLLS